MKSAHRAHGQGTSGASVRRRLAGLLAFNQDDHEYRRAARLLSPLLLVLLGVIGLDAIASALGSGLKPADVVVPLALVSVLALSRTRYYTLAAGLTLLVLSIPSFVLTVTDSDFSEIAVRAHLVWLVLPIILSGLLLSLRGTVVTATAIFIGILLLPVCVPGITFWSIIGALGLIVAATGLMHVFMYHRTQVEKDRQAELRESEAALRHSEARTRAVLNAIPDMIFEIAHDGTLLDFIAAQGLEPVMPSDRFIGKRLDELLPPQVAQQTMGAMARALQTEEIQTFEYQLPEDEGKRDYEARFVASREDAVLAIVRDITERKRAEEVLRESQTNLQTLFDSLQDFLFVLDLEGHILHVNPRVLDHLGYVEEELSGKSVLVVHPPDRHDEAAAIVTGMIVGEIDLCTIPLLTKDGVQTPVETRIARGRWSDRDALFGISRDITERKEAEAERERLLADLMYRSNQLLTATEVSVSTGTILDPEELIRETVTLIQKRFDFYYAGLFLVDGGYAVLQVGTGQAGREMLAEGHRLAVGSASMIGQCISKAKAQIALDVGEEALRFENPYLPETRSEMALPLISRGQCIGALTVQSVKEAAFSVDDVATLQVMVDQLATAIVNARLYDEVQRYAARLEERVAERTAELTAVNRELEAFAYSVSHDLRAPLRSMDGFSKALVEDYGGQLDAVGRDYLRRVQAASQRMGRLIDDLLTLSRLTRREMHLGVVDLSALAQAVAAELQGAGPERQVEFVIATGVVVDGDAILLRAVIENLMGNAWKFTSKHPQARIEFGVTRSDGEEVYFVRDDGAGFDMAYAANLFGAFQRLHQTTEFEGSGIGLATVQRIIHRHGGRVWAEGEVEGGATFYFTL